MLSFGVLSVERRRGGDSGFDGEKRFLRSARNQKVLMQAASSDTQHRDHLPWFLACCQPQRSELRRHSYHTISLSLLLCSPVISLLLTTTLKPPRTSRTRIMNNHISSIQPSTYLSHKKLQSLRHSNQIRISSVMRKKTHQPSTHPINRNKKLHPLDMNIKSKTFPSPTPAPQHPPSPQPPSSRPH